MRHVAPPHADEFRSAVYGTVFGQRMDVVHRLRAGDRLILVPDPPGTDNPAVWVHASGGDVIGHLPFAVSRRLVTWMLEGGRCRASVEKVGTDDVASWRRLIIRVRCVDESRAAPHA
ncbi:MAG TPA: hypothetical protein VF041_10950 [Gemmatimonadaceae bacterium]